jgi:RHS repeat-associated protein
MVDEQTTVGSDKKNSDSDKSPFVAPQISLPKGGGAIRGIGEKFAANPVTGTGSLTVPIYTSPGRSGFGPQLSLSYDSGAGNGPFGFGWSLSLPSISRKTEKGLPQYVDAEESDTFILSSAEDLVPVLVPVHHQDTIQWKREVLPPRTVCGRRYQVHRYRPRVEGLFARIERWVNLSDAEDSFWRSISRENITTWYGKTPESRIADPANPSRIFKWLICESYDDRGNIIAYRYKPEDSDGVDFSQAHERNRTCSVRSANRYIKHIFYGNRTPYFPDLTADSPAPLPDNWCFELVFDYGEHDGEVPFPKERGTHWNCRRDPFSTYRPTFEVRTYRLCRRVLMFHHFESEPDVGLNCLVRSTDFTHAQGVQSPPDPTKPFYSYLLAVTQTGYRRNSDGSYLLKSLPPLEFEYAEAEIDESVRQVDPESLENFPYGLDGTQYQWVDLDGEGLSGILTEQAGDWFYKPNLSPVNLRTENGRQTTVAKFGPSKVVAQRPSLAVLAGGRQQLLDLSGDGQLDLVQYDGPTPGFFERTEDENWLPFTPFQSLPRLNWRNPNLKFIDLTGDGFPDLLISEDNVFWWYNSLAAAGFGAPQQVPQALNEEKGPRLVFTDSTESIFLADLSGDGLTDLVRIRNGEVCYWPNLGYGHFGAKITMDQSPWFESPDLFDCRRIRLADLDGSGTSDIVYFASGGVDLYFNQSGNGWAQRRVLSQFPPVESLSSATALDLLGNGTACLVWSSPLPGNTGRPMRYVDLMGGQKPHLLIRVTNNLGAETRVQYAPSTKFYVADKLAGTPWLTRIPFPVHVAERVEIYDYVSRNRFVTRYAYHHGYYDGVEREFRGFGMVEQFDTQEFAALSASGDFPIADNIEAASHVPPVHTKTWFHTGVFVGRAHISSFFAGLIDENDVGEYYREPGLSDAQAKELLLDDTVLPVGLTVEEEREACRALKGSMLRQEVYAMDGTVKEQHPYTVIEQNFTIRRFQPQAENRYTVFFTHAREAISYHYERAPADPRIAHALTLEVDEYGDVVKQAAIAYGRRQPDLGLPVRDQAKQAQTLITYTESGFTNPLAQDDDHRTPLPCETRTYELTGLVLPAAGRSRFTLVEVLNAATGAAPIPYEQNPTTGLQKRLIEQVRTLYRRNDLAGPLPFGELESLALPFESYKIAFTPGLLANVYGRRVTDEMLAVEGRYVHGAGDANWWLPSGRMFYSPNTADAPQQELAFARAHFFLPRRYRDPFHTVSVSTETAVTYDAYDLLTQETQDALGNRISVGERDPAGILTKPGNDYRVLQPKLVMDPNGNRSAVAFDVLGMVVGSAFMGKPEDNTRRGDTLDRFEPDLIDAVALAHLQDPLTDPNAILGSASTRLVYDLFAYLRTKERSEPQPAVVYTLARETHEADLVVGQQTKIQHSFSYSDGFGREIQKKIQAEAGPVPKRDSNGRTVSAADGQPEMTLNKASARWVGSGWTVFNNKGRPVRQYEPFFTDTHRFEFNVRIGVSPVLFYDPVERVVATLHPNHTWAKVVFDPWRQETWDVNDTMLVASPKTDPDVGDFFLLLPDADYLPTWYAQRQGGALGPQEQAAARKAAIHADTPTVAHADSLGRTYLTVAQNKFKYSNAPPADPPVQEFHRTRMVFDMEGNQREVVDGKDRVVMRYDYDMLGNRIHQASMEAGERWILNDAAGKPLYAWDSRNHRFRNAYDALRRPTDSFMREGAGADLLMGRTIYGETQPNPEINNLRGKVVQVFDQAGVAISDDYDFKGNVLRSERRLAHAYKTTLDWSVAVPLEPDSYTSRATYDALNRPTELTAPDSSVIRPGYNEANLLERVEANLRAEQQPGQPVWTPFVTDIDYDAKGQRTIINYGNGVRTTYEYDPLTFRLVHLLTRRNAVAFPHNCPQPPPIGWSGCQVQNLHYTYDPIGNITHIRDDSQQTVYFRNKRVEPSADYIYDAIYRLIEATGREHLGQIGAPPSPNSYNDKPRVGVAFSASDGSAIGRYHQRYEYDAVGNFQEMVHRGSDPVQPGWTRTYTYDEPSLLEPAKQSNRLTSTTVGAATETYSAGGIGYDAHGNMLRMPQLQIMQWDFKDQLQMTQRQAVNAADDDGVQAQGERTWYVYDAGGQRVRKVTELATGRVKDERIYLGGLEISRRYGANPFVRETLHIMDDKRRIALVETRTQGNEPGVPAQLIRYQFGNHLGSASLELDDQAQIISYEEYTPYGSTSYQAVRRQTETPKRYRYVGKERDEESGLYYHGARYYAPWLARWTACDPSGLRDGVNVFAYVNDDPINKLDQTGNWEISWKHVAIGAGVAVVSIAAVALTAGAAAPVVVPAVATFLGVSEATVVTGAVVLGTAAGVAGTADTAAEVATGRNSVTGATLTDEERSLRLGALPVQAVATVLGARGISLGGGGAPPPAVATVPKFAFEGPGFSSAPSIRLPSITASPQTLPLAVGGTGTLGSALMMSMMSGGGGGGSGSGSSSEVPKRPPANRERRISRQTAELELREALESETLTPRQREVVQLITDEYGVEAIEHFRETGAFPEGARIENSHPYSVQTEPELATRPGDLVPRQFHRYGVHPGDTNIPLEGDPLAPNYAEESGFLILDENGTPIGQMGVGQVNESALNMSPLRR